MPGNQKPNIVLRPGFKLSIPQGYILGRTAPGVGPVELIPISGGSGNDLTQQIKNSGQLSGNASTQIAEMSMTLNGGSTLFNAQFYYVALCPVAASFPSSNGVAVDKSICRVAPLTDAVFYLVTDIAAHENAGYPTAVAATITFTAGSTTGTIVWLINPTTVTAGQQLYIACAPSFTDLVIEGVAITLVGDYVSG